MEVNVRDLRIAEDSTLIMKIFKITILLCLCIHMSFDEVNCVPEKNNGRSSDDDSPAPVVTVQKNRLYVPTYLYKHKAN
ncbi:unnamed protein product [Schistosoma mattheei]|uniref:Uncharacterized protein n=1 Tax=Schistosoma mattheei TaxID=31246 RepID=A0AA85BQH3_9TREM|nr:unnamed protein product [Schistosoma mattheei]